MMMMSACKGLVVPAVMGRQQLLKFEAALFLCSKYGKG